jgi:hypothetical protein
VRGRRCVHDDTVAAAAAAKTFHKNLILLQNDTEGLRGSALNPKTTTSFNGELFCVGSGGLEIETSSSKLFEICRLHLLWP